jgi:hypothetical protein
MLAFAIAILVGSSVGAWIGYEAGAHRTNVQIRALNADRTRNRATIMAQQKAADQLIEAFREGLCVLIERNPPDAAVDAIRARFRCGPYLPPGSPGRQKIPTPPAQPRGSTGSPTPTHSATPKPSPTASRPPTPHPSPPGGGHPAPSPSPSPVRSFCLLIVCLNHREGITVTTTFDLMFERSR